VLNLVHTANAIDKRDNIYSILILLGREDREAIQIEYSSSNTVEQVCTDLARYRIGCTYYIRTLEHAGMTRHISNMPSWVPKWSV
jgi:hypothetical protein